LGRVGWDGATGLVAERPSQAPHQRTSTEMATIIRSYALHRGAREIEAHVVSAASPPHRTVALRPLAPHLAAPLTLFAGSGLKGAEGTIA
jgi:hypothetical protein